MRAKRLKIVKFTAEMAWRAISNEDASAAHRAERVETTARPEMNENVADARVYVEIC